MRIATWNIGCGAKGFHAHDPDGISSAIVENDIDVCLLQEVDRFASRSRNIDFPEFLGRRTGMSHRYSVSVEFPAESLSQTREYGNLVLSRIPIQKSTVFQFDTDPALPVRHAAERETRTAIAVAVGTDTTTWCVGTHLAYSPELVPSEIRRRQIVALLGGLSASIPGGAPIVLGGDFNTGADSDEMTLLKSAMRHDTPAIGPTWPVGGKFPGYPEPYIDIDHVFSRGMPSARSIKIDHPILTDHSLVIVDYR